MKRQKPIHIEIKESGKNFAVYAEDKLVAIAVYRKGATTIEALLRGLIHYTSRGLFRLALAEALTPKEPDTKEKPAATATKPKAPKSPRATKAQASDPAQTASAPVEVKPPEASEPAASDANPDTSFSA